MIYFGNASSPVVRAAMLRGEVGMLCTPAEGRDPSPYPKWAADNGCYGKGYPGDDGYLAWLRRHKQHAHRCFFATAPDVVGDAAATLERSRPFFAPIRRLGYPVALVAQDGITSTYVPWREFDVLFLGGTDEFKLGGEGAAIAEVARQQGKRVHMGRVNSGKRLEYAIALGCQTSDGTFLARGPDQNLERMRGWYARAGLRTMYPTLVTRRRNHVVMFSGGVGSWAAARRVVNRYGAARTTLLFADTLIEDPDLYRFLEQAVADIGAPYVRIADGRTPWQVFKDKRYLGNTRVDPCSDVLKRALMRSWIEKHCDPRKTVIHLGIDWSEEHRLTRARPRWEPWRIDAPMTWKPYVDKEQMLAALKVAGIEPPRLYSMGFAHNNCGGGCVKAGAGHFKLLLEQLPEVYREWEHEELQLRDYLGKDVAILRDRTGGKTRPLTLLELRERVQADTITVDEYDIGGCGCAVD